MAVSVTVLPSATEYGPPASALGASFIAIRTTDGSWSDAWSANSALTCTGSKTNGRVAQPPPSRMWSSACELPSKT